MGLAKRELERKEDYFQIAYKILKKIDAIRECDFHSDFYYETYNFDESDLNNEATSTLKKEYPEYNDITLFHDSIKNVLKDAGEGASKCPFCEKMQRE